MTKKTEGDRSEENPFLAQLGFLDTEIGMTYCCGDAAFYKEVLRNYLNSSRYTELQKSFWEKDWETYRIAVHTIKSTSLSIGAGKLSEQAAELEQLVKSGAVGKIAARHDRLMQSYGNLLSQLRQILDSE